MNDAEEVKSRLDIIDVIGGYVPLKQAGRNWKGLSPFKTEKTPSFMVSAEKNIWHDFSTGKGGDVISFVMEMEAVSFPEALEMLARRAGVTLKPQKGFRSQASSKTKLYDANEMAMKYFHLALSKATKAKAYFTESRKLKTDIIKQYKLGYAPDSWQGLSDYLSKQGFTQKELVSAGLVALSQKSGRQGYDIFRGRVMFPIFDMQNRVIGFSARILDPEEKAAKYINTPQTDIYNKSFAIYGLAQAKDAIRQKDQVVIVEGNMDVLALANAGFQNVVACSGTALTELQLKQLCRLTKNIYLSFDADEAGVTAAGRAIEIALPMDIRLHIVTFTDAKDPDELIKKDKALWQKAVEKARYAPDYLVDFGKAKFNLTSAIGKKDFVQFLLPLLHAMPSEVEQQHYIKRIAQAVEAEESSIQKLLKAPAKNTDDEPVSAPAQPESKKRRLTRLEKLEQELLELLLSYPKSQVALEDVDPAQISELHRDIFVLIQRTPNVEVETITKGLPDKSNYATILSLRGEQHFADLTAHDKRLEAFTQVARIQHYQKELNKRQLAKQLADAEAAGDTKKVKTLLRSYQELLNEE